MRKKKFLAQFLAIIFVLNLLIPMPMAFAADVYSKLQNLSVSVTQNGSPISDGGVLNDTDAVQTSFSFDVPVEGDGIDSSSAIHKGDTASFVLTDDFSILSSSPIELRQGGVKVATVSFNTDPSTKEVTATVTFDGADEVFDGRSNSVSASFNATLNYISDGSKGDVGDHSVGILDKTFTVRVPAPEIVYSMDKSGSADLKNKVVKWTVNIGASQAGSPIDLENYVFSDDLSSVGPYVANSFEVNDTPVVVSTTGSHLSYTFPSGSNSPQKVSFETGISDSQFYATSEVSIDNTALLNDTSSNKVVEDSTNVKFTPTWISKSGTAEGEGSSGTYNPTSRTIKWTITANLMDVALNGLIIKDVLPSDLTYTSATYQTYDTVGGTWNATKNTPAYNSSTGEFSIGDVTSRILLEIVTDVPDDAYTTGEKTYTNKASMTWDTYTGPEIGTGNVDVTIGYNAISKTGSVNAQSGVASWTVKVDTKNQSIPSATVYDLFMYGANGDVDLNDVTGLPSGVAVSDLSPHYNQKYIDSTFSGSGLTFALDPITKDGQRVGDLLKVTGLDFTKENVMTFDTLITNPNIFASNTSQTIYNTAMLFSGTSLLNKATASPKDNSLLLSKELLTRTGAKDSINSVNSADTSDKALGFNYVDKTAVFRINVNPGQMDLSNMKDVEGNRLGQITVTDTLPSGWDFVPLDGTNQYAIFEGDQSTTRHITASDTSPDIIAGMNATLSGNTASFVFDQLDKSYVILLRAKPDQTTLNDYFKSNKTTNVNNIVDMTSENSAWTGISSQQQVEIKSLVLNKTAHDLTPGDGQVRWTVDYQPYDINQAANKITDKLGDGIDVRLDNQGKLDLSADHITMNEMTLNEDGTYTKGAPIALVEGTNIFYDASSKELSFTIPNPSKGYEITYLTDISGNPGTLSNHVYLYNSSVEKENNTANVAISSADGQATFKRSGYIELTKEDQSGTPLSGAVFGVYTSDGKTLVRKGTSDASGVAKVFLIPQGDYLVKEMTAPAGYTLDPRSYDLSVTGLSGSMVSTLNYQSGADAYKMTVKNTLSSTAGNLKISKFVTGTSSDKLKSFDFKVTLEGLTGEYGYLGSGVSNGSLKSGDIISLADGQSITLLGLPIDTTYTVEEVASSASGFTISKVGDTGKIVKETTQDAIFTNKRIVTGSTPKPPTEKGKGQLIVSKQVENESDLSKVFDIRVTIGSEGATYPYVGNGIANGVIKSGETIGLKANQSIRIVDIEEGTSYQVEETKVSSVGYKVTSSGTSGQILADEQAKAVITNHKLDDTRGLLEIIKSVENSDTDQSFEFVISFDDEDTPFNYTGIGILDGQIVSGDSIHLANEQGLLIEGIPDGMHYSVSEVVPQGEIDYAVINPDGQGIIIGGQTQRVTVTNEFGTQIGERPDDKDPSHSGNDTGEDPSDLDDNLGEQNKSNSSHSGLPRTSDRDMATKALLAARFFVIVILGLVINLFMMKKKAQEQ